MARVINKASEEFKIDCPHCKAYIAYTKDDVKEIYNEGFREPELIKSWIICPACNRKIKLHFR